MLPIDHNIGEETWSPWRWLVEHWNDVRLWLFIGGLFGAGMTAIVLSAPEIAGADVPKWAFIMFGSIGTLLVIASGALVYLARKDHERRTDALQRRSRVEGREEATIHFKDAIDALSRRTSELEQSRQNIRGELELDTQTKLGTERASLIEQGRKQAENELRSEFEALDRAVTATWTPEAVGEHVGAGVSGIALFAADRELGKPVLWIELTLHSIARVPCDVFLEIVECNLHSMPVPGQRICDLEGRKVDESFDGSLRPGTLRMKKPVRLVIPDDAVKKIRSLPIPSLWVLLRFQLRYRLNDIMYTKPISEPIQRDLSFPLEWR